MKTCCQTAEVYATPGDVSRISQFTGRKDFVEFRKPDNPDYADQDEDPAWQRHVFRNDGTRRILQRLDNGNCTFLGEHGCVLPVETRPLVCRLYPFDYTETGIRKDLAPGCPLELLRPGQGLIEALAMKREDAQHWHQQLYQEMKQDGTD
jgi:Fe-S-cluster containining protein